MRRTQGGGSHVRGGGNHVIGRGEESHAQGVRVRSRAEGPGSQAGFSRAAAVGFGGHRKMLRKAQGVRSAGRRPTGRSRCGRGSVKRSNSRKRTLQGTEVTVFRSEIH